MQRGFDYGILTVIACGMTMTEKINNMKPDKAGIWEWFEEDGTKRLVSVCDVGEPMGEQRLRVYWWGGYYDVNDRTEDIYGYVNREWAVVEKDVHHPAEWPDRWGNYVGPEDSVPEDQKYWLPSPEQRVEIMKQYEKEK